MRRVFLLFLLPAFLPAGCGRTPATDTAEASPPPTPIVHVITVTPAPTDNAPRETPPEEADIDADFSARENREGERVFALSAEDYIAAFNGAWGEEYLPGLEQWEKQTHPAAPHANYETDVYMFRRSTVSSMPEMRLYVPAGGGGIQQIMLAFDHHGYTDWGYEIYAEQCLNALKLLLPESGDGERAELFQKLYLTAERSEACYIGPGPWTDITPSVLYRQGDVGLYPCYGDGLLCICAVPVTEEYADSLTGQGIQVHEIPAGQAEE